MPTKPPWSEVVLDALDARNVRRERRSVGLNFPPEWQSILLRAAETRDVSLATYARRASMAFAVYDLGLDWKAIMQDEPRVAHLGVRDFRARFLQGYGCGAWQIVELATYERD